MPAISDNADASGGPSLMDLPPELRLRIYDELINSVDLCVAPTPPPKNSHTLLGEIKRSPSWPLPFPIRDARDIWALSQVCALVRRQVLPLLPPLSALTLDFRSFSRSQLLCWTWARVGEADIAQIRRVKMHGEGHCPNRYTIGPGGRPTCYTIGPGCAACAAAAVDSEPGAFCPEHSDTRRCRRSILVDFDVVGRQFWFCWKTDAEKTNFPPEDVYCSNGDAECRRRTLLLFSHKIAPERQPRKVDVGGSCLPGNRYTDFWRVVNDNGSYDVNYY